MAQVLDLIFVFLGNPSNIDLSSWMAFLMTSITFVFLGGLGLRLTRVGKREILRLSFVFVPILVLPIDVVLIFLD